MSDPAEDIADALVTHVNAITDLSLQTQAFKPEDPWEELKREHADLKVMFTPAAEAEEKIGRGGQVLETVTVSMTVIRKLQSDMTRAMLGSFVRELKDRIRGQRMAGWVYSTADTVTKFDPRFINEMNQFVSVVHLNYVGTS